MDPKETEVVKLFGRKKDRRWRLKGESALTHKRYWLQRTKQSYSAQDLMDAPSILDELEIQIIKQRARLDAELKTIRTLQKVLKAVK